MAIILLAVIIVAAFVLIGIYNGLVKLRNDVKNAFKQIDVQLKRRHDLIPNLVNSVKGEMKFEQDTLEKVMKARAAAIDAGKGGSIGQMGAAEGQLTGALGKLLAVVEAYPDLKAHQNVSSLMEELKSTENKVAFSRQFYNDLSTKFNTKQQVFPTNLIAGAMGFTPAELFEIENEAERENVTVDLAV
ncbi:MAG: LemA family protein [Elusimicrobiaceae bacterium]|nr:LemA family protein [Elusimicrobiaceae bacterium]